ncbi:ElyC/SanA/YdcF family protein [Shewanella sp. Isolate7]|uniref:ElyC/SanA/YdcF family protein n=1 Tax=Shewanella sp. Isolate7 TaxID=2908528 RepID=UPI001EFC2FDB|nr:ElyC/SanA/YdcF family protein [Shewanella sp. Isolate7]MCG9721925.1 YdcF family protein [Shewanella sp. Isolate7]
MFWVKKLISQLLMPIPLSVFLLFIAILILRRRKLVKTLIASSFTILLLLSSQWGSYQLANSLEQQYPVNNTPMAQGCVVMVLGSGHDSSISERATLQLSATALARLTEGVRQLGLGQQCQLVVSGWGGSDAIPQAEVMANAAIELGVKPEQIIQFPLAKDTLEEAQFLEWEIGDRPFRLVTSATHLPRAMMIFHQAGMHPQAAPADFIARGGYWWQLDARNLLASQRAIHEYVGQVWLKIKFALAD